MISTAIYMHAWNTRGKGNGTGIFKKVHSLFFVIFFFFFFDLLSSLRMVDLDYTKERKRTEEGKLG